MFSKYPHSIPEKEKMGIFINNLVSEMTYQLKLQCPPTFCRLIENRVQIEEAMVEKGDLKLNKDNKGSSINNNPNNSSNNLKPKFWMSNKNVVNDEVVDANNVKTKQPAFNLSTNTLSNNQNNKLDNNQQKSSTPK